MWKRKLSSAQKQERKQIRLRKKRSLHPTRCELRTLTRSNIHEYCERRQYNTRVTERVLRIWTHLNEPTIYDDRDFRAVPFSDRVPRSLETPESPKHYWNIDYFST